MIGDKVKYTCKKCGWNTSIRVEWADLRPKRCMNKKCNCSFLKYKEELQIDMPKKASEKKIAPSSKKKDKKKASRNNDGKTNNQKKRSS